jgi:hypothetical protein
MFQIVDCISVNDLKFIYVHLQFQNFSGVIPPDPRDKGEGRERDGMGGDEPPKTNPVYGPACSASVCHKDQVLRFSILPQESTAGRHCSLTIHLNFT